jgi:hypothetical protein
MDFRACRMILHHVTLTTGHFTTHRLDVLDAGAVAICRSLLPSGGPVPAFAAFRVQITGPLFTVWRGREPLAAPAGPYPVRRHLAGRF